MLSRLWDSARFWRIIALGSLLNLALYLMGYFPH